MISSTFPSQIHTSYCFCPSPSCRLKEDFIFFTVIKFIFHSLSLHLQSGVCSAFLLLLLHQHLHVHVITPPVCCNHLLYLFQQLSDLVALTPGLIIKNMIPVSTSVNQPLQGCSRKQLRWRTQERPYMDQCVSKRIQEMDEHMNKGAGWVLIHCQMCC